MPDPFIALPTEISLKTLSFLSPWTLAHISIVSKLWYALTNCPDAWRSVIPISDIQATANEMKILGAEYGTERRHRIMSNILTNSLEFPPSTKVTLAAAARSAKPGLMKQFAACCHNPKSFFIQMTILMHRIVSPPPVQYVPDYHVDMRNLLRYGLAASTTDEYDFQDIGQTLSPHAFWSSTGSDTGDVDDVKSREWLCYRMEANLCVIKWIEITPYMATWQIWNNNEHPIYAPKRVRFSVGFTDNPAQMHYHSRWFDVECINAPQFFPLFPDLVVGEYLFITIKGKYTTQPIDDLYYTVFDSVKAYGASVGPQPLLLDVGPFDELARTLWKWRREMLKMLDYEKADDGQSLLNSGKF